MSGVDQQAKVTLQGLSAELGKTSATQRDILFGHSTGVGRDPEGTLWDCRYELQVSHLCT
jgi:hypothetical protein